MHKDYYDDEKPKTETITKSAKKSFINWLVPALCVAILMGCFTIAKGWADDRYTLKSTMNEEVVKREALESKMQEMNRKLDLILYILQHEGKLDTLKGQP